MTHTPPPIVRATAPPTPPQVVRLTQHSLQQRAAQGRKAFRVALGAGGSAAPDAGLPAGRTYLNSRANPTPGPAGLAARGWLGAANRWVRLGSGGCACAACGEGDG